MKKNNKNKTTLIIAAVVLVAIAGIIFGNWMYHRSLRDESDAFRVIDTASITKVFLADKLDRTTLLERKGDYWSLNTDYKAHPKTINQLLYTLNKMRIRMPVSVASHNNIITQMASRSTKVEIYQMVPRINLFNKVKLFYHEKRTKVFYVGESTMDNNGTFMLSEGDDQAYIVFIPGFRGYISTRFSANPDDWRDHTIFHESLADIQSLTIEFGDDPLRSFRVDNTGKHQYQLTRLGDNQVLPMDTLKVINLLSSFNDVRFEAIINNNYSQQYIDSVKNSQFLHRITLVNKEGETMSMKTYTKRVQRILEIPEEDHAFDVDRMYAFVNDDRDFVLVQYYNFDKLLNDVSYYEAGNPIQYEIDHYQIVP